jgi:GTP-binding protein
VTCLGIASPKSPSPGVPTPASQARSFVSKLPGRTQHLNFFTVAASRFLVDLPGYGFARAPKDQQYAWQELIGGYLASRQQLVGLVVIMDIRHPLTDLDWILLEWFRPRNRPIHVLLSKADKLSRGQRLDTQRAVRKALADKGFDASVQLFSSLKKEGAEEAEGILRRWLDIEKTEAKKNPAQGEKAG